MVRYDQDLLMPTWARTPIKREGSIMNPYEYEGPLNKETFDAWEEKYNEEQRQLRGET
jgi:hypothetical protein